MPENRPAAKRPQRSRWRFWEDTLVSSTAPFAASVTVETSLGAVLTVRLSDAAAAVVAERALRLCQSNLEAAA